MDAVILLLITKNLNLQITIKELVEKNLPSENIVVIESESCFTKTLFKIEINNCICVYDSDFSSGWNSILFTRWANELFSEMKIIVLGNGSREARELINSQAYPFGYVNKKENHNIMLQNLLDLLPIDIEKGK